MKERRMGPYRLLGTLGEGGMGVVYRAVPEEGGEEVALKTVRLTSRDMTGFRQEIRALSRIRHPRIVRVLAEGTEAGRPWYAMELLRGQTLRTRLATLWSRPPSRRGPLRLSERPPAAAGHLPEVLDLVRRLCVPVSVLHGHGIVHRDLKPANVMLRDDGEPVVMDLGVASRFHAGVGKEALEIPGRVVGTVGYMAPEQAQGRPVDSRADLFSLACIAYELLTGRLPYEGVDSAELVARLDNLRPPPPSQLVEGLPDGLDEVLLALLAASPAQRTGYADELARALDAMGARDPLAETPTPPYLYRAELVGRDAERALLETRIGGLGRGDGGGGVVLVGGESGVGKTYLVSVASQAGVERELTVIASEALPVLVERTADGQEPVGAPLHPLRPLLQVMADDCRRRPAGQRAAIFKDRSDLLLGYEPSLRHCLLEPPPPTPDDLPAAVRRELLFQTLHHALRAWIAVRGPVVLLVDDLQWADDLSLGWLHRCCAEPVPDLLVIGTFRSENVQPSLRSLLDAPDCRVLLLPRLEPVVVGQLLSGMLALPRPPAEVVERLVRLSAGNPYVVAESLHLSIADGRLHRTEGAWRFAGTDTRGLTEPQTIGELFRRRLDWLSPAAREVAEAAAVLGRGFTRAQLETLADTADEAIDAALRELREKKVLEPAGDGLSRFAHDMLRESTHEAMAVSRRRELHRRAAAMLDAEARAGGTTPPHARLAQHWREAEDWPRAVDAFEAAAFEALEAFANTDALAFLNDAASLADRLPGEIPSHRRGRWALGRSQACQAMGLSADGRRLGLEAVALLGEASVPEHTLGRVGIVLRELATCLFRARWPARPNPDPIRRGASNDAVQVYARLTDMVLVGGEVLLGTYTSLRAVNLGRATGDSPGLAHAYGILSAILAITPLKTLARRWAGLGIAVGERTGSGEALSRVLGATSATYYALGDWASADAVLVRAAALADRAGHARRLDEVRLARAVGLAVGGRHAEAMDIAAECLGRSTARHDPETESWARALLMECLTRTGRAGETRPHRAVIASLRAGATQMVRIWLPGAGALAAWHDGAPDEARTLAETALAAACEAPPAAFFLTSPLAAVTEVSIALSGHAPRDEGLRQQAARALSRLALNARFVAFAVPIARFCEGLWFSRLGQARRAHRAFTRARDGAQAAGLPWWAARADAALRGEIT